MEKVLGVITRDEWIRRYAARIQGRAGWTAEEAAEAARVGAEEHERDATDSGKSVVWWGGPDGSDLSPETLADEEMSCWTDDGDG